MNHATRLALYQLAANIIAGVAAGFEWGWKVGVVVALVTYSLTPLVK